MVAKRKGAPAGRSDGQGPVLLPDTQVIPLDKLSLEETSGHREVQQDHVEGLVADFRAGRPVLEI